MAIRVEIHPTAKIAAYALSIALAVLFVIVGAKRLLRPDVASVGFEQEVHSTLGRAGTAGLLMSVVELRIPDAQLESHWSSALAEVLSGTTEAPVDGGRVDVLTEHYAIEVDRLEKWHEAIGQAIHYAAKTGKAPVAAIMLPSDLWPPSVATKSKLLLIDEMCTKAGIKLVLLRRSEN